MNAIEQVERRHAERVPCAARVMVVHTKSAWFADLTDLSEGGCGALHPPGCELEAEALVRLFFYDGDGPAVVVPARVARIDGERMGFEYHESQNIPPMRA